jgi:hypothetical protein
MFLMGLGALLVLGGVLYMARTAIWRGPLSGPDSSRPVRDTLEPPRRSVRFLGLGTNWPGILLMAVGAILGVGGQFLASATGTYVSNEQRRAATSKSNR